MEDNPNLSIKCWAEEDRPREKLMLRGRKSLTDAELIAILIGSGNSNETAVQLSQKILLSVDGSLQALGKLTVENLMQFKGIGEAKAITIIAALELARRRTSDNSNAKPIIRSSTQAYQYIISDMLDLQHEEFWCIYLNRRNEVITKFQLSKGSVQGTVADVRIVFKKAVELLASSVFIFHNHPSGALYASEEDKKLTSKFIQAGALLDIMVIDHLIITDAGFYSFADHGMMY
jgi:DNA repair protein RadC